jgi:hypothetical protein
MNEFLFLFSASSLLFEMGTSETVDVIAATVGKSDRRAFLASLLVSSVVSQILLEIASFSEALVGHPKEVHARLLGQC